MLCLSSTSLIRQRSTPQCWKISSAHWTMPSACKQSERHLTDTKPESAPRDWEKNLTAIVTLLIVSGYGIGYLILTLSDGAHGFLEFSLLKPRAIITGAAFIFITALPISMANIFPRKNVEGESRSQTVARRILTWAFYRMSWTFGVLSCYWLFADGLAGASIRWSSSKGVGALFYLGMGASMVLPGAKRSYRMYPKICTGLGILCQSLPTTPIP
jgi:hypothetical protein